MRPPRINKNSKWVGVCLTPALIEQFEIENAIVVVIDVLRATTSMCVAFDNGVRSMLPVASVQEARDMKAQGFITAGERDGIQIEDFDLGNSPFSYMDESLKGKDIAITTTNGTQAIQAALRLKAKEIIVGSFANLSALTAYLLKRKENVVLLCSGWKDKPNLEDTIFAGAMVRKLRPQFYRYQDTALIAETLYRNANRRKRYFLRNSSHFNRLFHILQIQKDVKYALRPDLHPVLPVLVGDRLVDMNGPYWKEYKKKYREASKLASKQASKV